MKQFKVVERIEADPSVLYYQEHLARYRFSDTFVRRGNVLDIATGTGYGSEYLSRHPDVMVVGVDVDLPSLRAASVTYRDQPIRFVAGDGCFLPFGDGCFSTIVTLETIEHIADDAKYVNELNRVLELNGACVISTPNRLYSESIGRSNPFHMREYTEEEFVRLLRSTFPSVKLYYQGFRESHYSKVQAYTTDIQQKKRLLNPIARFVVDRIYRPLRKFIPAEITNSAIRRFLRVSYPQPASLDIVISDVSPREASVFIGVCRRTQAC